MKQYKSLLCLALLLLTIQMANSQTSYLEIPQGKRFVEIQGVHVDENGNYNHEEFESKKDIIFRTIRDDVPNRTLGDGTVYVLKRNHVYVQASMIEHQGLDIHIRGEAGAGRLPLILHDNPNANAGAALIRAHQNVILENFEFDGKCPDTNFGNRLIDFRGPDSRVIIKGCRFTNDRGGAITIEGAGLRMKLYVYDCVMGNQGHYISYGGNGRALDIRVNNETGYIDTVVFKNNTIYNLTDRVVRSMGGIVTYMEFDHNTFVNNQGVHGSIQFGNTKEGVITNNIFVNPITLGNRLDSKWRTEQTQQTQNDHPDKAFAIVTHNGTVQRLKEGEIKRIVMRNNNIFFEREFLDLFAAHPTLFSPTVRTASDAVLQYLDGDPSQMSFSEVLAFDYNDLQAGVLGSLSSYKDVLDFTKAFVENPERADWPENWSKIYPHEWNAVYPTSSRSYTAGDNGFPLGDLNWFPADKARWLSGSTKSGEVSNNSPKTIAIERAFPNPFVSDATVDFSLTTGQRVEISVYNSLGQKISTIYSGQLQKGAHRITWDGKGANGTAQPNGFYFLMIAGSSERVSSKFVKSE